MNTYIPGVDSDIHILGRTASRQEPAFFWTGSGIEFMVDGSGLSIDFITDYEIYEQWIRVEVDGFTMIRTSLPKGRSTLTVYRNMNPDNRRRVRVLKEEQPCPITGHRLDFLQYTNPSSEGSPADGRAALCECSPYGWEAHADREEMVEDGIYR